MSSRKEQKEALRKERLQREQEAKAAQRRKQLVGYGVGGAIALAAVVILVVLLAGGGGDGGGSGEGDPDLYPSGQSIPDPSALSVDLPKAAKEAGCELEEKASPSREHIGDPNETQKYDFNPPAAGRHFEQPAPDGIYNEQPRTEELVHTLEHGRVIIWFKKSLPADARGQLKTLFDEDPIQLVLTPDDTNMSYEVAATAWGAEPQPNGTGYLMGCPQYNENAIDALRAFIGEHRGNGPEPVP